MLQKMYHEGEQKISQMKILIAVSSFYHHFSKQHLSCRRFNMQNYKYKQLQISLMLLP
jgi:hypothetical protein